MSAPQSSRKPLSTKGRALKAAVAAVAVAAAGGLVTAFSYARDPVRTSADALVTNYDLESGKPLHWQGMKQPRIIIGIDTRRNKLAPYYITAGDNYVPVLVEERAADGTSYLWREMALLKGASFNGREWTFKSVELATNFIDMNKWARLMRVCSQDDPVEALRQANPYNIPDFAREVGPAYPVSLVIDVGKPVYHHNANTGEESLSFSVSDVSFPIDLQTGKTFVPAAPAADLGVAMVGNWQTVKEFYEYLQLIDKKIRTGVADRLVAMDDTMPCIDESTRTMSTLYAMQQVAQEIRDENGKPVTPFALKIIERARQLYIAQKQPNMTGSENTSGFGLIPKGLVP